MGESSKISVRNLIIIWVLGLVGQICWNVENQWFNTFVYAKIGPYPWIISYMTAFSAALTTFSTFFFGTWSDRAGKRRPFVFWGYILWGVFTVVFGAMEFIPKNNIMIAAVSVVAADALMSAFGSMGNDAAFNSWTTDITNEKNRGQLGGILAAVPVLATLIGTVVSGILISAFDYFAFFIIIGVVVAAVGAIGVFFMREGDSLVATRDEHGFWHQFISVFNFKSFSKSRELVCVFLIMAVYFTGFNAFFLHIGNYFIYTLGFKEDMVGILEGVGLLVAVFAAIPAMKFINRGKHFELIVFSVLMSVVGLIIMSVAGKSIPIIEIAVLVVGIGYVLLIQTTTAWCKNLYPEGARGQFEGVRIIFFVLIPMITGPAVANFAINTWGHPVTIDGESGMAPSAAMFLVAAVPILLTLVPNFFAKKEKNKMASKD